LALHLGEIKEKIKDGLSYLLLPFYALFFSLLREYFELRDEETGEIF